jgi:hypothetical protein
MKEYIPFKVVAILLLSLVVSCSNGIKNCDFNPGVKIESKTPSENKDDESLSKNLPVQVSPKGEVACTF